MTDRYRERMEPPQEVIDAARTITRWAEDNDLHDWTVMGIGPRVINEVGEISAAAWAALRPPTPLEAAFSGANPETGVINEALRKLSDSP